MYPQRRMVSQSLRLGLLVTLVVLALSACGGNERFSKPQPLPEEEQQLRTGVYRSEEFKPSLTFRVGEGWSNDPPEVSDAMFIVQGETRRLGFVSAQEVFKPTKTGTPNVMEAPEDLVGWFQQHPYLQTDKPQPVSVGGVKGLQFDVVVEDLPEDYLGACVGECVDGGEGVGWIAFLEDHKQRVIVLEDVKGKTVTMGFTIPATEFDEHAPEAQKVLDSVEWRDS
jgi:hypothetical protein